jgi:cell fate regulator YaaT (PSP1 superfamily)
MDEKRDRKPDEHIEPPGVGPEAGQAGGHHLGERLPHEGPLRGRPAQGPPEKDRLPGGPQPQGQPPQGAPANGQPLQGGPRPGQHAGGAADTVDRCGGETGPVSIPAVVQVEFKGERRGYFINSKKFPISEGDYVVVQVERGRDTGKVVRCGDVLDKIPDIRPVKQEVLRRASEEDMRKWEENKRKEEEARRVCEEKIASHGLKMKLVEVEYQLDGTKITFFFTADERVDFRELVKDLAGIYKTRIELRQIGVRDEAKRLGGYGSCGRKFCCTTFLQEFEPVTLRMARDQRLSLSPTKISGACGRLMCCLAYEREYYMEVARQLPKVGRKLMTPYGEVTVTKIDIFAQAVIAEDENGEEMRLTLEQFRKATQAKAGPAGSNGPVPDGRRERPDADAEAGGPEAGEPGGAEPGSGEGE